MDSKKISNQQHLYMRVTSTWKSDAIVHIILHLQRVVSTERNTYMSYAPQRSLMDIPASLMDILSTAIVQYQDDGGTGVDRAGEMLCRVS